MKQLKQIEEAAVEMALACGQIQLESFRQKDLGIDTKTSVYDVVTRVDKACEAYLIESIARQFPTHTIIGEETGSHVKSDADFSWVVDPLDGTNSYSQGLPVFCVSIGITFRREPVVGVVYAPYLDELFTAVKGNGAWMSRPAHRQPPTRLAVSDKTDLRQCVLASGFPYDKATHPINNIREASVIIPLIRGFRRMGSAAYDLCSTAMGTIDAYWEYDLKPYDCCAGEVIVKEAGGSIVPIRNDRHISIIAGPEALTQQLYHIIAQ